MKKQTSKKYNQIRTIIALALFCMSFCLATFISNISVFAGAPPANNPQSGSIGVEGTIPTPAPTTGASITSPGNNQTVVSLPLTIIGICPEGLLVKVFKNNVFSGSVLCTGGSYQLKADLFSGRNELIARVYDSLDQPGPDSNLVVVNYNDDRPNKAGPRVSVTSNYAKRGANPGATLGWPLSISGGNGPYAVSIEWGDGKSDLLSRALPGEFSAEHVYDVSGVYNVVVKATDKDGTSAFLQLVSIINGIPGTDSSGKKVPGSSPTAGAGTGVNGTDTSTTTNNLKVRLITWPFFVLVPFIAATFWLGRRHEVFVIRKRLQHGERPFK